MSPNTNGDTEQYEAREALRKGGVVLIRHTNAPSTGDPPGFSLEDCSSQRNLSEQGRVQAEQIGERFQLEKIVLDQELHSRWCRAKDTAELAFPGLAQSEPAIDSFFHYPEKKSCANEKKPSLVEKDQVR